MNHLIILTTFPYFYGLGSAYQYAVGPLLYLFVRSLIDKEFKFTLKTLLHFVPFFFFQFQEIPNSLFGDYQQFLLSLSQSIRWEEIIIRFIIGHLQPIIYAILLIRFITNNDKYIKKRYAASDRVNYNWMQSAFYIYAGIWIIKCLIELFLPQAIYNQQYYYIPVSILLTSYHIYIIAYLGLNRTGNIESYTAPIPVERYKSSQLSEEKSKEYLKMLLENMETEESFKDPKLTLPVLANRLSMNSRYLSQVINENLGQNFYDFINSYRIEEAKKRLVDPEEDKYTIEAIAFEVGFNSKAAFYSTFKKQTNMTPSQFKEQKKNNSKPFRNFPASSSYLTSK